MTITPTIERAIKKAGLLHQGQFRKTEKDVPHLNHLLAVSTLLSEYAGREEVVVAGILHDSLEDTPYTEEELEREFGKAVREIVEAVTEVTYHEKQKTAFSWEERKGRYLKKLKTAGAEALMVSAADKIHNLSSMIDGHRELGPSFFDKFNARKERQLWFFGEVLKILEERLESPIVLRLRNLYKEAENTFGST